MLILEGCLTIQAENIPLLPDADNAAAGTDSTHARGQTRLNPFKKQFFIRPYPLFFPFCY